MWLSPTSIGQSSSAWDTEIPGGPAFSLFSPHHNQYFCIRRRLLFTHKIAWKTLPHDHKNAIIVPVSHEDSTRLELENTVRKLLEGAPVAVQPAATDVDSLPEARVQTVDDIDKTAHDLRASLNIIIGFSELMLDEVMGKINKEQRRSLNDILNNGKRLLVLSDEIIKRLDNTSEIKK
jgi:signal transduction histidine kinase